MADSKLSTLTELAATPANNDEVYIRDVSEVAAAESKRITVANLLAGAGGATIATGSYSGNNSQDRQITTSFKCSLVIVFKTSADFDSKCWIAIPNITKDFSGTATTAMVSLHGTDGFYVGDVSSYNANKTGDTYYYWAISE